MDLDKLMHYYQSDCPPYRSLTCTEFGAYVPAPEGALREGYPLSAHRKRTGGIVIRPGVTVRLHAGMGANHGNQGERGWTGQQFYDSPVFRFRFPNTHVDLTGPMSAREVLECLARHVALQVGRNLMIQDRGFFNVAGPETDDEDDENMIDADQRREPGDKAMLQHWRHATPEERDRFSCPTGPAPLLELDPDPLQGVTPERLLRAASRACTITVLEGIVHCEPPAEPLSAAGTAAAAAAGGAPAAHHMATWSEAFC